MPRPKRKRLFVDPQVQGSIILRVMAYWCCCFLTVTVMLIAWRICISGPARPFYTHFDDLWFQYGPAVVAVTLLMPMVIYDVLKLTNRFVGPVYRLRKMLNLLAKGEKVPPLSFREGDYWRDIAADFNAIAARLQALEVPRQPAPAAPMASPNPVSGK